VRILIDYRPALLQRTGVGEYAHEMARALAGLLPAGDRLTLFSSSWKDRLEPGRVPGAEQVDARVPVRLLNLAWHRLEWPPIERFAGAVDIAHSMHPLLMPARHGAQVVTIYDLFFLEDATGTAAEIRRDYTALARTHAARADLIVVISKYTASQVTRRLSVPDGCLVLCPPGAPSWPRRPPPQPRGPILYIGSAEVRKNVGGLLSSYGRLRARDPDTPNLVLAGRPPVPGSDLARSIAATEGASHAGYVSDDERQRLYATASLLVVPSLDEGFGMPALEAMTVGVPVVSSNRGALPEVVGDAAVLIDPVDPEALAAGMRRILASPEEARARAALGFQQAARYSWKTSAMRLLEGYREVHERRRRSA
jgi:glycosyltransferase involved in cell wall biosynthesis